MSSFLVEVLARLCIVANNCVVGDSSRQPRKRARTQIPKALAVRRTERQTRRSQPKLEPTAKARSRTRPRSQTCPTYPRTTQRSPDSRSTRRRSLTMGSRGEGDQR